MPTLPAPVARTALRLFGSPATITEVEDLSPGLRRATLRCPVLPAAVDPGCEVEFCVDWRNFRHYSPCAVEGDELRILFHRPTPGPGGKWVDALAADTEVAILGPVRHRHSPRPLRTGPVLLLGDATALGMLGWLAADARDQGVPVRGAVELPIADLAAGARLAGGLDVVPAEEHPGQALHRWIATSGVREQEHAVLVGHAQSLQALRADLLTRGVSRRAVTTRAYWSTGRTGL